MIAWFSENIGTILITLFLILFIGGIILSMIRDKKRGASCCGGSCGSCNLCHSGQTAKGGSRDSALSEESRSFYAMRGSVRSAPCTPARRRVKDAFLTAASKIWEKCGKL